MATPVSSPSFEARAAAIAPEEAAFQTMPPKLLIVTDLGLLKAYRVATTPKGSLHLDLRERVVFEEARERVVERVTDLAGRHAGPTQKNWGPPLDDPHRFKLETRRRLIKQIAGHIARLARAHPQCGLWLAAHREINHQVASALGQSVRRRIQTNLMLDLVRADEKRLLKCFAPWK